MKAASTSTEQAWDIAAAGWNNHAGLIHQWLAAATQMMLEEAQIYLGSRVLDIAAGAGDQTLDIARLVGPKGGVLAVDISPAILALAKMNVQIAGFDQVRVQVADAESLNLAGENFDAAICRLGLMFCRSPVKALNEIQTALKPAGRLSVLVFSEPAQNPCLAIALKTAYNHRQGSNKTAIYNQPTCEPGSLMSLGKPGLINEFIQAAGFVDIKVNRISAPFFAPSVEHYIAFLQSAASPVKEILKPLSDVAQRNAWLDMTEQLRRFSSTSGWNGPNELLLASATSDRRVSSL
jgi:ubiquinone/menaquinone biosynthesis C-methylase UbiE